MRPAPRTDEELLVWAASIIRDAQERGIHGEIRVQMKDGKIISTKVESCHLPPRNK